MDTILGRLALMMGGMSGAAGAAAIAGLALVALLGVALLVLLVVLIVWVIRQMRGSGEVTDRTDILRREYAAGHIDRDEYLQRSRDLADRRPCTARSRASTPAGTR